MSYCKCPSNRDARRIGLPIIHCAAELPNAAGFRFIGIFKDGAERACVVVKNADGHHHVDGVRITELKGWRTI